MTFTKHGQHLNIDGNRSISIIVYQLWSASLTRVSKLEWQHKRETSSSAYWLLHGFYSQHSCNTCIPYSYIHIMSVNICFDSELHHNGIRTQDSIYTGALAVCCHIDDVLLLGYHSNFDTHTWNLQTTIKNPDLLSVIL